MGYEIPFTPFLCKIKLGKAMGHVVNFGIFANLFSGVLLPCVTGNSEALSGCDDSLYLIVDNEIVLPFIYTLVLYIWFTGCNV